MKCPLKFKLIDTLCVWGEAVLLGTIKCVAYLVLVRTIYIERRGLIRMSDEQLSDIGVSRAQAEKEAKRGLLDLPKSRLLVVTSTVSTQFAMIYTRLMSRSRQNHVLSKPK